GMGRSERGLLLGARWTVQRQRTVSVWCSSTAIGGWQRFGGLAGTERSLSGGSVIWRKLFWVCWHARRAVPLPLSKRRCCCGSSRRDWECRSARLLVAAPVMAAGLTGACSCSHLCPRRPWLRFGRVGCRAGRRHG